jgi:predicted enzyme related to lactoylglutathione lyase
VHRTKEAEIDAKQGRIAYLQIPAADIPASARFYREVFGWGTRERSDGARAFDDTTGRVSGEWVVGREPSRQPGLLPYIEVEDVEETLERIASAGGEVVSPATPQQEGEAIATFRDPAGNVLGIFHQGRV